MNKKLIISQTEKYIREKLSGEGSGHDWWHIYRVWSVAKHIAKKEKADSFIVELAALLHDIADWKFSNGDEKAGGIAAKEFLENLDVDKATIQHIAEIVDNVSFKGAGVQDKLKTIEGKIVQDADRLDAIGAVGVARAFAYGGHAGRQMHDPKIKSTLSHTFKDYKKSGQTTINHFYEKLLLLQDRMHTKTARKIAQQRHTFMEKFLKEFYFEWDGKR